MAGVSHAFATCCMGCAGKSCLVSFEGRMGRVVIHPPCRRRRGDARTTLKRRVGNREVQVEGNSADGARGHSTPVGVTVGFACGGIVKSRQEQVA